ncbi:MAG: NADP-dependent oxidoreductase [Paracoccaceae bacterium]
MQIKRVILAKRPNGEPTLENFNFESFNCPKLQIGEIFVKVLWLSLDPYMRGRMDNVQSYAPPVQIGEPMEGECVAEIIDTKNENFVVGELVVGKFGWVTHAISNGFGLRKLKRTNIPEQTALGVLGMPGHTAWTGLNKIANAQKEETIIISAAAGAVGSLVGQLAKKKGLKVLGIAGNDEKCSYVKNELGFDSCINHNKVKDSTEFRNLIKSFCPNGVDIYFENVAGQTLEAVIPNMNDFGRIAVCGMISWYSGRGIDEAMPLPKVWRSILVKRLKVNGFIIFDHKATYPEFIEEVSPLIQKQEIIYKEDIRLGLENAPLAFLDLLNGRNFGKMLVKVSS